jgi:hypothetical protein
VFQKDSERFSSLIAAGAQPLECGHVSISVLVTDPGIPTEDGLGLRSHVRCELLHKLVERHCQIPFLMFSIA